MTPDEIKIDAIIKKEINDHLVRHVPVLPDKRCRIDILCERAAQSIVKIFTPEEKL